MELYRICRPGTLQQLKEPILLDGIGSRLKATHQGITDSILAVGIIESTESRSPAMQVTHLLSFSLSPKREGMIHFQLLPPFIYFPCPTYRSGASITSRQ